MTYINSLNTVRAIALFLVLVEHWLPKGHYIVKLFPGVIGVTLFFTLSGYLITGVLIKDFDRLKNPRYGFGKIVKNFILRRCLRILPPYYFAIVLAYCFKPYLSYFEWDALPYLLTFTFNFYIFHVYYWPGTISHFWTLSVEEQFYLFWPFAVGLLNIKWKTVLIISTLLVALLTRWLYRYYTVGGVLTPACLDSFAIGAGLAYLGNYSREILFKAGKILLLPSILGTSAVLYFEYGHTYDDIFYTRLLVSLFSFALIVFLIKNETGPSEKFRWFWQHPVLIFIGKMSYGMYLYHLLLPSLVPGHWFVDFFVRLLLLTGFSWFSWKLLEQPILSLKSKFV